jgi:hypothetical protein
MTSDYEKKRGDIRVVLGSTELEMDKGYYYENIRGKKIDGGYFFFLNIKSIYYKGY